MASDSPDMLASTLVDAQVDLKKLIPVLRVDVRQTDGTYVTTAIGEKLKELNEIAHLRNLFGCHYNQLAAQFPEKDALHFATLVEEVGAALICEQEGWPEYDKLGSYWATRKESRRLHPLKKPR